MFCQRNSLLGIAVQPRRVILPAWIGRRDPPGAGHGSQGKQRGRLTQTFFQPEIGLGWKTHHSLRSIVEVGQGVTEFVRKLKAVLRPMSVLGSQADRDAALCRALDVRLWVIKTMIDINPA